MIETTRPAFISFSNKIIKEDENGEAGTFEIFVQIHNYPVTEEELLEIKKIQKEAIEKVGSLFNKSKLSAEKVKKQVLTYKDGRPAYEEKEE